MKYKIVPAKNKKGKIIGYGVKDLSGKMLSKKPQSFQEANQYLEYLNQKATPKETKLTEKEKKIQAIENIRTDGGTLADSVYAGITPPDIKKPKTVEQLERDANILGQSLQRLTDKKGDVEFGEEFTEKDQRDYDYYKNRLDDISRQLGTYVPESEDNLAGDLSPGDTENKKPGYWERAKKDVWIKNRINKILAEGKLMYGEATTQASEDWDKEHNKKDPAGLFTK